MRNIKYRTIKFPAALVHLIPVIARSDSDEAIFSIVVGIASGKEQEHPRNDGQLLETLWN